MGCPGGRLFRKAHGRREDLPVTIYPPNLGIYLAGLAGPGCPSTGQETPLFSGLMGGGFFLI